MEHSAARRIFGELQAVEVPCADDVNLPSIEGYIIDRLLGRGAGGDVYRGFRDGSDRPLAIKVLNARLGDDLGKPGYLGGQSSSRAWRELDVLTQLRLPALPRVIDHGVHQGRLYIATEYIDGQPLDQYCQAEPSPIPGAVASSRRESIPNPGAVASSRRESILNPGAVASSRRESILNPGAVASSRREFLRTRVDLLARVADAVHSLHEMGVIHRDIKPSNILVDINGQPIIIDLGIASLLTDDVMETLTAEGAPIGSPAFMSPEQARGSRREISTRSDVYGLGATAYLILTGQTPHEMDVTLHESVRRVAQDEPRDPRELDGSLPRDLAAVLTKAVSREPARRYTSAADFAEDLRRWLAGEPVTATTPGPWRRCTRWIGKHPIITTTAACAVIALAIVGTASFVTWRLMLWPDHLEFSDDGKSVRLVTSVNKTLRTWRGEGSNSIRFAQIVDRPGHLGGGRVLVIATQDIESDPHTDNVCIYNLNEYDGEPVWTSAGTITLPDQLRYAVPCAQAEDAFEVSHVRIADIFPEEPGSEVVAFHQHSPYSPTAIRVYDLAGQLLYETWHDGHLSESYWMSEPGLLVAAGCNSDGKWQERGYEATVDLFPTVVFAIRPELGVTGQVLSWPGSTGTVDPTWYWCVLPSELSNFLKASLLNLDPPSLKYAPESRVQFLLATKTKTNCNYSWILDAAGNTVAKYPSSGWKQEPDLPDPSLVKLGVLPMRKTARPDP